MEQATCREKQVIDSVNRLDKILQELEEVSKSFTASLGGVLSPSLPKDTSELMEKPIQCKASLSIRIDGIAKTVQNIIDRLKEAQSRLEV